jgi:Pyruvate phosphate dikinase, AMP/ATP-binding domain
MTPGASAHSFNGMATELAHLREAGFPVAPGFVAAAATGVVRTSADDPDHIVIECGGRYVVDKMLLGIVSFTPVIDKRDARRVADLGRSVEHHYRAPQEVEWAIDERDRLWLLRVR